MFGTRRKLPGSVQFRLSPSGGFFFATVHNIQPDVSPENIMAMREDRVFIAKLITSAIMNLDVIVIGHLLKEKIIFPDGRQMGPVLGSPAAYSSVASAKLDLKTGLVTKIGKDMPKELLKVFRETGVDTG